MALTLRGPEDIAGWSRPHKRFRAAPHDAWLMSQPVSYSDRHVFVADTGVYTVDEPPRDPLETLDRSFSGAQVDRLTVGFPYHIIGVPSAP